MSEQEGIIYPPPDLRVSADRTAYFVAKNGASFEEKILIDKINNPKFCFLQPKDPFHAYYKFKVREERAKLLSKLDTELTQEIRPSRQQADENSSASQQENTTTEQEHDSQQSNHHQEQQHQHQHHHDNRKDDDQQQSTSQSQDYEPGPSNESAGRQDGFRPEGGPRVRQKLNDYIEEMSMKLEEPALLNYLASSAPHLMQRDCDIIRLTSQFIATYGRSFLIELVSREQNNSQFDFLKPQHGQFSYMTNLIMQYALIRNQPLDITEQLTKDAYNQKHVLDKIKMRAEWTKMLELERKKREEEEEKERILYGQINWQDFVIVETIDYQHDEKGEYPPTTADQVGTRLLLQQRYEEQTVPEEMDIDMDVESDDQAEDSNDQGDDEFVAPSIPFMPEVPAGIVIRTDYDPKAAVKVTQPDACFVSPITNERIPAGAIGEHIKYNLSDPRYLEKKDQALQGRMNEEQVFAAGSQIQDALKSLAERRTDIFGMDDKETDIGRRIGEEEQAKNKDDRLVWDGYKSSLKKKKLN